jgi:4-diphosphocytidyl-2-C-methyl-D-erythritol kinase
MALRQQGPDPNVLAATRMYVRQLGNCTSIDAPAKLNLSLEILGRRDDGYHDLETLMVCVSVCDTLEFTPTADGRISLACRWADGYAARAGGVCGDLPTGPDNLVWRAVSLVRERAGIGAGADIRLTKRIPSAAGLGGASSDSAAALVAASASWKLGWPHERLAALAEELGSDVPFFLSSGLRGGAAVCRGRGERIEPVDLPQLHVVVVKPPVGLSTPLVYQTLGYTVGQRTEDPVPSDPLVQALGARQVAAAARMLNNRLEVPASRLTPWIGRLRDEFSRLGVLGHQMSGSGSSYFGICTHARHARRVAACLRGRSLGTVFAAATVLTNTTAAAA